MNRRLWRISIASLVAIAGLLGYFIIVKLIDFNVERNNKARDTALINLYLEECKKLLPDPGYATDDVPKAIELTKKIELLSKGTSNLSALAASYYFRGNALRIMQQFNPARAYLLKSIQISSQLKNNRLLADTYGRLALTYSIEPEEIETRTRFIEEAQKFYELCGAREEQGNALTMAAELCMLNRDYLKAQRLLNNALAVYQTIGIKRTHFVYDLLNQVNVGLGINNKAIEYGQLAIKTALVTHDTTGILCTFYNRLGIPQYRLAQYQDAIHSFETSLKIAYKYNDTSAILIVIKNLADTYIKARKFDQCLHLLLEFRSRNFRITSSEENSIDFLILSAYNGKKDGLHAEQYYNKLLTSIDDNTNTPYELNAYIEMIRYKINFKQFDDARRLINKAESLYTRHNMHDGLKNTYLLRYTADSSDGKFYSAAESYKKYKAISDSIGSSQREKQVQNLEKQFSSEVALREELKEQSITLLRTQSQLQVSQLRQAKNKTYFLLSGLIIMAAAMALGYRVYLLKQRNNRLLEKQKQEIDKQNVSLKRLIDQQVKLIMEKEWLVKEVHHRVKNNLQIIVSLLNLQSKSLHDQAAISAITSSQNRVKAMSFIHQRLYLSDTLKYIDIENYVKELIQYLKDAMYFEKHIEFILNIRPVKMDVAQVVPIGLILNEAITNAIKYAFSGKPRGKIMIELDYYAIDYYILKIADDGIGLPEGFDWENTHSLGTTLIKSMAEQLEASLSVNNDNGLRLTFIFKQEQITEEQNEELINIESNG